MRINSLLVLWNNGWFVVDDPAAIDAAGYRAEAFLSLGAQHTEDEARTQAVELLARYQETRQQLDAEYDPPSDAERPYAAFGPADTIQVDGTPQRVTGVVVKLTDDGPVYVPRFGTPIPSEMDRVTTAIKKMSPGSLGGDTTIATPISPRTRGAEYEAPQQTGGTCARVYGAIAVPTNPVG